MCGIFKSALTLRLNPRQTLKNGANGFDGHFPALPKQTAHRAKHGKTR